MGAPRGTRGALIYGALLLGGRWPLGRDYFAPDGPASILDTGLLMKVSPPPPDEVPRGAKINAPRQMFVIFLV